MGIGFCSCLVVYDRVFSIQFESRRIYVPNLTPHSVDPRNELEALLKKADAESQSPLVDIRDISKKHVRILVALFMVRDQVGEHYADITGIRQLIAQVTGKLYSHFDVEHFADNLTARGYIVCIDLEEEGKSYKIEDEGVVFLNWMIAKFPSYVCESNSPNVIFETVH